jgi:hypothetical protein
VTSPTRAPHEATEITALRLGKYVLDAPLGVGGMAEVFRAHTIGAEGFERAVAIKRILPDASRQPAFSEMFIAEAKLSSRMQHPNIVGVLDFDRDADGRLYLAMELVEGRDLDGLLETGRLPWSLIIHVVVEVLRGLAYAHDLPSGADGVRGLVHRDISPHNVLIGWNGAVKVSDFGIAKARAATSASASVTIKGKPAYMSPEQINGEPLDGRSDLFAVGVMLWQMLTGQHLFAGGSTSETLARVLFAPVTSPRTLAADVPADLEAVTMQLLARDPAQRPATADDAIDELLRCRDAPRDGRRDLERLLIERFPQQAPVRTGQRQRLASGALAMGTPVHAGDGARAAALMNAATRTSARAPDAPRGTRAGVIVAVALASAVITATIAVVALAGGRATATSLDAGAAQTPDAATAAAVDAPGGGAVTPGAELDAGAPLDAPTSIDASNATDARRPPDAGPVRDGRRGHRLDADRSDSSPIHEIRVPDDEGATGARRGR